MTTEADRRGLHDRRRVPRGGRRDYDRPGRYPPVLVADSYEGARVPCVRYLDRFNFDVVEADNGEDALRQIVSSAPRLILTEWALPAMPADRLCQWLAQGWRTREIPVIVVAADFDVRRPIPSVASILVKPFSLDAMLHEVRRVLRESPS
jgi:two-component system, OmpR family, phosphate regulon response regulator PhoB